MKHAILISILFLGMSSLSLAAPKALSTQEQIDELNKKIQELQNAQSDKDQALIDEMSTLKDKILMPDLTLKSFRGMGPAASKVYYNPNRLSIGGYGELKYTNTMGADKNTDLARFIPYIGYRFTDYIILNTEIEFEHAGAKDDGREGEAIVEFAYLDFLLSDTVNIRAGNMLLPVGLTNTRHEPVNFNSVDRPEIETLLIPSTWNENGIMLFGTYNNVEYNVAVVNGFDMSLPADGGSWVSAYKQGGAKAKANNWASVASLSYGRGTNLELGGSYYYGQGSQNRAQLNAYKMNLWEAHFIYQHSGFEWRGLYASGSLSDAELISTPTNPVGSKAGGYYTTVSYDIARLWGAEYQLPLFTRFTKYNLNEKVAPGFSANPAYDMEIITTGVNFKPVPTVTLKANYLHSKTANNKYNSAFQLGMGFVF
ncbi:MAG: porin [Bdellovibrionaceae bacterium]|nr:porin [Pseudobdellovibrionaceae bacterium]